MSDYDPVLCEAFKYNSNPPFTVPAGGEYRLTIDCSHCAGWVQNYQVTLMGYPKRNVPNATLKVLDASGAEVGVNNRERRIVAIGNVPDGAIYTVVVTSGSRKSESCRLFFLGAI